MPNYTAECSDCGITNTENIKLICLEEWDSNARCPNCSSSLYKRIIRHAPSIIGGPKAKAKSQASKNRGISNLDADTKAEAIESAATGKYEDF